MILLPSKASPVAGFIAMTPSSADDNASPEILHLAGAVGWRGGQGAVQTGILERDSWDWREVPPGQAQTL